ncbi:MAG TPA: GNAT family N-acetyltransferase [Candidatus Sulfotelmatobacter sp.]|nr:GNAT family N-acetyltransferase [Candidatus Sulfotelmatobacter sp.]
MATPVASPETKTVVPCVAWNWPALAGAAATKSAELHSFLPLQDVRWDSFLEQHPRACVFHTSAWLQALYRTYGYEAVAFTTSGGTESLQNAVVFCRVESWLTGRRLVSLPFSDHCEPLMEPGDQAGILARILATELESKYWRYVEMRPLQILSITTPFIFTGIVYAFHQLDLRPDINTLFRNLHKSSIQRKIGRAERERLVYREGSDSTLLDHFYGLMEGTRRRHGVPPQPRRWFANLMECFGPALKIRVSYKGDRPVAAMITLRYKDTLVYKYGCSDPQSNNLGGMHLLYWRSIQDAKAAGLRYFDLGRTDADQQGLITFKNRWGAAQSALTYSRYGVSQKSTHFFDLSLRKWSTHGAKYMMSHLPRTIVSRFGDVLYRHVG